MQLQVLFEDNHLIAVNKPVGYLVHGDETGDTPLTDFVKDYIAFRYKKPGAVYLGVIHRLDRPASGIVLFARTSKGLTRMNDIFKRRKVEKTYWAITAKRPDPLEGELTHFIGKDREKNQAKAFSRMSNQAKEMQAKKARLSYRMVGEIDSRTLLEISLETGRPHQIRAQLSSIGCAIVGDVKYGYPNPDPDGGIHLHARSISFEHPVKKEAVTITADPPDELLWNKFAALMEV